MTEKEDFEEKRREFNSMTSDTLRKVADSYLQVVLEKIGVQASTKYKEEDLKSISQSEVDDILKDGVNQSLDTYPDTRSDFIQAVNNAQTVRFVVTPELIIAALNLATAIIGWFRNRRSRR